MRKQRTGTNALRPVTIAQVINATQSFAESEFYIDGAEVKDVSWSLLVTNSLHAASFFQQAGRSVWRPWPPADLILQLLSLRSLSWRASGT